MPSFSPYPLHVLLTAFCLICAVAWPIMAWLMRRASDPAGSLGDTLAFRSFEPDASGDGDGGGGWGDGDGGD
jgi:hypothetical protein